MYYELLQVDMLIISEQSRLYRSKTLAKNFMIHEI